MRIQNTVGAALLAATLFTSALSVASADDCHGKKKKGCEVPEVPYAAVLPAATMAGITGFYFLQRRRNTPMASVGADATK